MGYYFEAVAWQVSHHLPLGVTTQLRIISTPL